MIFFCKNKSKKTQPSKHYPPCPPPKRNQHQKPSKQNKKTRSESNTLTKEISLNCQDIVLLYLTI